LKALAKLGAEVTAIDMCKENIITAKLRAELVQSSIQTKNSDFYHRIQYLNCALEELSNVEENRNFFDAIVMSEVIEHVDNQEEFLINSTKLLKNNGYTFITTINRTRPAYLLAIIGAEYLTNLVPRGTHDWNKFMTPNEIENILNKRSLFI
jgi:ubiquinone biosynthesis O-methyltransferase